LNHGGMEGDSHKDCLLNKGDSHKDAQNAQNKQEQEIAMNKTAKSHFYSWRVAF